MGDARDKLRDDVEALESVEELGRVEAYIRDLKAREAVEKSDGDKRQGDAKPSGGAS